jgi:hypothetical protein
VPYPSAVAILREYVRLTEVETELLRRYRVFIGREKLRQKMLDYEKADRP